jgi:replicative DNA helicase
MTPRLPPQNLEAEQSVLGGLMLDPEAADMVLDEVESKDFYKSSHQKIFSAIHELNRRAQPVDILTVSNLLRDRDELEAIGGPAYLAEIIEQTPTAANIKTYSHIVKEKSILRKCIQVGTEIIEKSYEPDFDDINTFINQVEAKVFAVADDKKADGLTSASDIVRHSLERIEFLYNAKASVTGVPSGFTDLDRMTAGFQPGELIILAARPSMGKTAFSLNIATNAAIRQKKTVAYFSVEMAKEQMMTRVLASEAQVNMSDVRIGRIADAAWPKLINTASVISEAPLYIDDTSGISPFEIRAKCRRLKAQKGLDMIMVDYLQIMDLKQKVESRERAVSEISKTLKEIAKEFRVPVIALAQLNRAVEGRADRRPMLSDLRESGSIEQDADVIMMLYRDDYYEKDSGENKGVAEIIIGKQRNGPTGTVKLAWLAQYGMFSNLAPESLTPPPSFSPKQQAPRSGEIPNYAPKS